MKLANISKTLVRVAGRTSLKLQKYSPEILLVVGVTGTVASAVMACRATLKVNSVLSEHSQKLDKIDNVWEKVKEGEIALDEYDEEDKKKDLTVIYVQTAVEFIKIYGPAVSLGVASIGCIIGGHGIMKKRNVALMAAYKAIEEGFNAYRKRVVEEHGEEIDYMYKNGLRATEVTEMEEGPDGKQKKVKKNKLEANDPNKLSAYSAWFDADNDNWSKEPLMNRYFLQAQQNSYNDLLQTRGHVFLNEVYDALGLERTSAGAIVGWVLGNGDNFIDFGIFDKDNERKRAFVNGHERTILLDFNVDGVIWDKI